MVSNEQQLIGDLLLDPNNITKIYDDLKVDMFENELCRLAYKKIIQSYDVGIELNLVDLTMIMEGTYDQDLIKDFLKGCITAAGGIAEIKSCATSIISAYKIREIKNTFDHSSFLQKDIDRTLLNIQERIEQLLDCNRQKGRSIVDIAEEFKDYYGKEHEEGIRTHIYPLDEILNGLNKGDVTILGARPAVGKSALATQILSDVAIKNKRVGYFNLEMTDQQIYERVLARYSGINLKRLKKAISFMPEELEKYNAAKEKVEALKDLIVFSGSYSAQEMKSLCKNQEFDLIVIDYLQLVKPDKNYGNRASEVGDISKSIKAMAMDLKVPVIALSQLNRRKNATEEPEMSDIRESGDIEQDASNILLMWNMDEDGIFKGLKIEKNRQGELGKFALKYTGSLMSFETMPYKTFEQVERECKNNVRKDDCEGSKRYSNGNPFERR